MAWALQNLGYVRAGNPPLDILMGGMAFFLFFPFKK
jgi:hypothetical protein